jgi:hypothetical protein
MSSMHSSEPVAFPGRAISHIRSCERCGIRYDWRRSTSASLRMTYCGLLCERGALGYTIEAFLKMDTRRAA